MNLKKLGAEDCMALRDVDERRQIGPHEFASERTLTVRGVWGWVRGGGG